MEISGASRWEDISYLTGLSWVGAWPVAAFGAAMRMVGQRTGLARRAGPLAPYPGSTDRGVRQEAAGGLFWCARDGAGLGSALRRVLGRACAVSGWRARAWPP